MNEEQGSASKSTPHDDDERMSALFATMVVQQAKMALMFLGQVPHPETGQTMIELEPARLFIDQLEMLEVKTRGNLKPQEAALLKQQLMNARLAFVEAANQKSPASTPAPSEKAAPSASGAPAEAGTAEPPAGADSESRRKFTKKY